jgi:hypothetical protein
MALPLTTNQRPTRCAWLQTAVLYSSILPVAKGKKTNMCRVSHRAKSPTEGFYLPSRMDRETVNSIGQSSREEDRPALPPIAANRVIPRDGQSAERKAFGEQQFCRFSDVFRIACRPLQVSVTSDCVFLENRCRTLMSQSVLGSNSDNDGRMARL